MEIFLTDTNKIKDVLIYNNEDSNSFYLDKIDTSSFLVDIDTLLDRNITIMVTTTDFRQHYKLSLDSNAIKKKEVIKFKALRR